MPIKSFRPLTPSQRFTSLNKPVGLSKNRPQRALTEPKHKTGGRNAYGRLTSRRMGGGHKQLYRVIDFKRNRSEEHTSELQSLRHLVCRLLLEKKKSILLTRYWKRCAAWSMSVDRPCWAF